VRFEEQRQRDALASGQALVQETRHWDEDRGVTSPLRSKEFAFDYRYFPEPDLAPIEPDPAWIERLRSELPELPVARRMRFAERYGLTPSQVALVGSSGESAAFFEQTVGLGGEPSSVANWMSGDLAALLHEAHQDLSTSRVTPKHLADLVRLLREDAVSSAGAKAALAEAFATGSSVEEIVEAKGLRQVSDAEALEGVIEEVVAENPGLVEQLRGGKEGVLNALVGQVMKKTRGSANPRLAGELLRKRVTA